MGGGGKGGESEFLAQGCSQIHGMGGGLKEEEGGWTEVKSGKVCRVM